MSKQRKRVSDMSFDEFWSAYPRKIARIVAKKAYEKALTLTDHETIMRGVERYKVQKPDYCDWCHPSTWLNQGRWDDDYGDSAPTRTGLSPYLERTLGLASWESNDDPN